MMSAYPLVSLKLATSLDGKIALANGQSQWITGSEARAQGHKLRAEHDAILVGSGTVLADDPTLTVRLPGYAGPQPVRIIADARLRTPNDGKLAHSLDVAPVWIFTAPEAPGDRKNELKKQGFDVVSVPEGGNGGVDICAVLSALARRGIKRLLVEGGGVLAASLIRAGRVDRLEWFRAPVILGADALPCVAALALRDLAAASRFTRVEVRQLGDDLWERLHRRKT